MKFEELEKGMLTNYGLITQLLSDGVQGEGAETVCLIDFYGENLSDSFYCANYKDISEDVREMSERGSTNYEKALKLMINKHESGINDMTMNLGILKHIQSNN